MHFLTFVVVGKENKFIEEAVEDIMAPYNESNEEYYEFNDVTDEYLEKYEKELIEVVKLDGALYSKYDDRFKKKGEFFSSGFEYPEESEIIEVPVKEIYITFDSYIEEYGGYEKTDGKYGYYHNPQGKWDFYQIGGRWTGYLDGYNPEEDPENIEKCWLCNGTGLRNDELGQEARAKNPEYTCNGCSGKGVAVKWPTQWKDHPGDIAVITQELIDSEKTPYALVTKEEWFEKETWIYKEKKWIEDENWPETVKSILQNRLGDYVVVVDYHV